jgi:hypothetical protein
MLSFDNIFYHRNYVLNLKQNVKFVDIISTNPLLFHLSNLENEMRAIGDLRNKGNNPLENQKEKTASSSSSVALQSEEELGRLLDTSPFVPISGGHPPIPTS